MIKKAACTVLVAFLLLATISPVNVQAGFLSPEEESGLGKKFLRDLRSAYHISEYPYLKRYLNDLGGYLADQADINYFTPGFYLIEEDIINAFAAPAGNVFVFSGLIRIMENADELACVMAHELGHVSARHLAARIERSKKIGLATMAAVLAGILAGGKKAGAIMTGSLAAGAQAELGFSREDERQADQLGFKYTRMAGFDPRGMISVLKKIQRENYYGGSETPQYLLTHPGTPERMANIDSMLRDYKKNQEPSRSMSFRDRFNAFHTAVLALYCNKEEAKRIFEAMLSGDQDSAMAHYGLGLLLENEGLAKEAIDHLTRAWTKKSDSLPIMYALSKAYQTRGKYSESVSVLYKALEHSPEDRDILYSLAVSLQGIERYDQAAEIYNKLLGLPSAVKPETYYNLGVVYGRQGKLALAHYNLGKYFMELKRKDKALFHLEKARELAKPGSGLKADIETALKRLE